MPVHSPNLPAASRRPLAARLTAGLCAALFGPIATAADVLVVTDSHHPVQAPAGARVTELDQAAGPGGYQADAAVMPAVEREMPRARTPRARKDGTSNRRRRAP